MTNMHQEGLGSGRLMGAALRALRSDSEPLAALSTQADDFDRRLGENVHEMKLLGSQLVVARHQSERMGNRIEKLNDEVEELSQFISRWDPVVIERAEFTESLERRMQTLSDRIVDLAETIYTIDQRSNQLSSELNRVLALLQDQTALQRRLERIENALARTVST